MRQERMRRLQGQPFLPRTATSIDALAVGFSFALLAKPILFPAIIIGLVCAAISLAGMLAAFAYNPARELVQLACGVAGLAAGFALSSLYFHFTKRKYTPTIDRKLEE